jgi:hypothetical protein
MLEPMRKLCCIEDYLRTGKNVYFSPDHVSYVKDQSEKLPGNKKLTGIYMTNGDCLLVARPTSEVIDQIYGKPVLGDTIALLQP